MKLDWNYVCSKIFDLKLVRYFGDTTSRAELEISGLCIGIVGEDMFLLTVFLLRTF